MPTEAGMLCTMNGDTFYSFTKNAGSGDSGALHQITNDNTCLFDIININKLIEGSSRNMPATQKGKLCINIQQVDGTEWVHTIWPVKFCPRAGANLFSLHVNSCREIRFQVTTITISCSSLPMVISSLI